MVQYVIYLSGTEDGVFSELGDMLHPAVKLRFKNKILFIPIPIF